MESGHAHDHPLNSELHGIAVIAASLRRIHCRSHCSAQGSPCGASLAPSRPPVRCLAPASRYAAVRVLCAFSQRFRTDPGTWSSFPRRRRTSCAASVATRHRCAYSQQLPSHRVRCSPLGPSPPFQTRRSPCWSAASPLMTATTAEVRRLGRTHSRLTSSARCNGGHTVADCTRRSRPPSSVPLLCSGTWRSPLQRAGTRLRPC